MKIWHIDNIHSFIIHEKGYLMGDKNELKYFYVFPDHRNKGIGSKLLKAYRKHANKDFFVLVERDNIAAIRFYIKRGLKIVAKAVDLTTKQKTHTVLSPDTQKLFK